MPDEAAGGPEHSPASARSLVSVVFTFPGELGAGGAVASSVADVEPSLDRAEDKTAVVVPFESDVGGLDQVEVVIVPEVHLFDPPGAPEGLGHGGGPPHAAASASSLGRRTRL